MKLDIDGNELRVGDFVRVISRYDGWDGPYIAKIERVTRNAVIVRIVTPHAYFTQPEGSKHKQGKVNNKVGGVWPQTVRKVEPEDMI